MSRAERALAAIVPFVAIAVVAAGLRLGAPDGTRAAVVFGAPAPLSGSEAAWQVFAFEERDGEREPLANVPVRVTGRTVDGPFAWAGTTNDDGIAEARLPSAVDRGGPLEVRSNDTVLARGDASRGPPAAAPVPTAWAPFARRTGTIMLDVAVLGGRASPGFVATLAVRATDVRTRRPLPSTAIRLDPDDPSVVASSPAEGFGITDSAGWAVVDVVPVGLAASLTLHARAPEGAAGTWMGGLPMSPGASAIETRPRWSPEHEATFRVVAPGPRTEAYVEIDDARGRVWAMSAPYAREAPDDEDLGLDRARAADHDAARLSATVRAPPLSPGLYWVSTADDPAGASRLGPASSALPFFVASTDDAALALGADRDACATRADPREASGALLSCLASAPGAVHARWVSLDGTAWARSGDRRKRARGAAVALSGIFAATLIEIVLLLRAALVRSSSLRLFGLGGGRAEAFRRYSTAAVAILVAILGFLLLAAIVQRAG